MSLKAIIEVLDHHRENTRRPQGEHLVKTGTITHDERSTKYEHTLSDGRTLDVTLAEIHTDKPYLLVNVVDPSSEKGAYQVYTQEGFFDVYTYLEKAGDRSVEFKYGAKEVTIRLDERKMRRMEVEDLLSSERRYTALLSQIAEVLLGRRETLNDQEIGHFAYMAHDPS